MPFCTTLSVEPANYFSAVILYGSNRIVSQHTGNSQFYFSRKSSVRYITFPIQKGVLEICLI